MAPPLAKNVTFSSDDQANKTMVLDMDPSYSAARDDDATVVLDLTATQVHELLEDTDTDADVNR